MLSGTVALVTGASRGIGRAIAAKFIELGAEVATVQRGEGPEIGESLSLRAVAFLVSPQAAYIHGIVLPVDGGYLAR